jgi:hypothetical protein
VKGPEHSHCPDCGKVRGGTTGKRCHECSLEYRKIYHRVRYVRPEVREKALRDAKTPERKAKQKEYSHRWYEKQKRIREAQKCLEKGA